MPYQRQLRFSTPLVGWHALQLHGEQPAWSEAYRVESPRLVLPQAHWIECEIAGRVRACDAVSPLWLTPETPYRLRQPWRGQRSVLLVLQNELPVGVPLRPALTPALQWQLAQQAAHIDAGAGDALALDELVAALALAPGEPEPRCTPRARRAVERARQCLAAEPSAAQGLAQIAHAAGESPFHLARRFRALTGHTLHAYRARLRMARALQRLRDGERDLSALALDLGYSSHSHFSASFRRCFGFAPAAARTQLRRIPTAPRQP